MIDKKLEYATLTHKFLTMTHSNEHFNTTDSLKYSIFDRLIFGWFE